MYLSNGGLAALQYLVDDWKLDLRELLSITEEKSINRILNKKQALTQEQLDILCAKFSVTPETFID
jgi:antitoxin component HigA of HigAB toxin-antitoxin module